MTINHAEVLDKLKTLAYTNKLNPGILDHYATADLVVQMLNQTITETTQELTTAFIEILDKHGHGGVTMKCEGCSTRVIDILAKEL